MERIINNRKQKLLRRKLRQTPIGCESKLWSRLRNKQLGYKFNRQVSIGKYVVDFFCYSLQLAIEIDGATHATDKEICYDEKRQDYIESLGIKVKRYNNIDITNNLEWVLSDIIEVCESLKYKPHPNPLLKGEGERKKKMKISSLSLRRGKG